MPAFSGLSVNKPDHLQINRDNLEAKHASKEVHDGENRKE